MFWVRDRERQGVAEGGSAFFGRNAVLPEVRGGLLLIPLERDPTTASSQSPYPISTRAV